ERSPLRHGGHGNHGHGNADGGTDDQANHDPDVVMNLGMKESANQGSRHPRRGHNHAAPRGVRMAQALQAHHEQAGGNQVCGFEKILAEDHFFSSALTTSFLRNILSMRSVIRKPPVTLIMAEVTARQPRTEARVWWCSYLDPAITN